MEKIYDVYQYGYHLASFKNRDDAKLFSDLIVTDDEKIGTRKYFESVEEIIAKNPKGFIKECNLKLEYLKNNDLTVGPFYSKEGSSSNYRFAFKEIKEIIKDGPKKLGNHISSFHDEDGYREFDVTEKDFGLFVKKYNEISKNIEKIEKYIKYAKNLMKNNELKNEKEESLIETLCRF